MFKRVNYTTISPGLYRAMLGFSRYISNSNLEESLLDLLEIRASQINGCAWWICILRVLWNPVNPLREYFF